MRLEMTSTARLVCALALGVLTACPDKGDTSDSATGTGTTTGSGTTTEGPTTGGTTTGGMTTGPTTGETTTVGMTTAPTTGDDTGGMACAADQAALEQACADVCANYDACGDVDPAACAASCLEEAFKDTPACLCGSVAWANCRAGLDCATLPTAGYNSDEPCFAESVAYLTGCGDCYSEAEFLAPTTCVVIAECPDVLGLSYTCSEGECACGEGDSTFKSCPDMGHCEAMDEAALRAAATACCGVPF